MILKVLRLHEKNDNRDWLNKMSAKSLCILHIDFSVLIFPNSTRTLLISLFLMEQVGYGMQTMIPSSSMSAENIAGCWSQPLNKLKPSRTQRLQTCTAAVLATTCPDGLPNLHISICLLFEARIGPVFLIRHSLLWASTVLAEAFKTPSIAVCHRCSALPPSRTQKQVAAANPRCPLDHASEASRICTLCLIATVRVVPGDGSSEASECSLHCFVEAVTAR